MDYYAIARILEKERCNKHKTKAIIIANNLSIELTCCCDKFNKKLKKQMELEMKNQDIAAIRSFF
jgi:hypothetical protein